MKPFSILIPWCLQLTVLQQEHYELGRFVRWVAKHFFERRLPQKKKLVWTRKATLIAILSAVLWAIGCVLLAVGLGRWGILIALFFASQPWLAFVIVQGLLLPAEAHKKKRLIEDAKHKLASLPNVKVIGIAGSYGKTSMKAILTHLLNGWKKAIATPLSYNVPLGIAQVIDLELTKRYDFFIAEMGEFYRGDIKELCDMLQPKAGMITGLNSQHAERLGTIEQAGATLFELAEYLRKEEGRGKKEDKPQTILPLFVNGADKNIAAHLLAHGLQQRVHVYASNDSSLSARTMRFTDEGTTFDLYRSGSLIAPCHLPLLGAGQVTNILGALEMAIELGAPFDHLLQRLESLPQVPHRLERKIWDNGMLLIDDAYNSNFDGFRQALDVLSKLPRGNKILVTPGIIELGDQTRPIHEELGKIANGACSLVILVGKSDRTEALAESLHTGKKRWIGDITELWTILPEICPDPKDAVVLLENDLPESAM